LYRSIGAAIPGDHDSCWPLSIAVEAWDRVWLTAGMTIGGESSDYVRDVSICRVFLEAARNPHQPWTHQASEVLDRPEIDWHRWARYLSGCGLSRPLIGRLRGPYTVPAWAPSFFTERLHARASQDAVDDLLKREALNRIISVLRDTHASGVLLKGTALQVRQAIGVDPQAQRATGDIDLYIQPPRGTAVRLELLNRGFTSGPDESRTASHHLPAVTFQGVAVEIHERLMPTFWGLPEDEMLARLDPVEGLEPLSTLSPEGLLIHAGVHASAHLYAYGLKTAWDLFWIRGRFPELDWELLARWVGAARLPRGFWVPIRVLSEDLSIPLSSVLMRKAPQDARELKLERFARHRLFSVLEGPFDLNPFSKTAVFLLLHDSWSGRAEYLAGLREKNSAAARATARRQYPLSSSQIWRQIREALVEWRRYRRSPMQM
jgi:hypothetical protein